MNYRKVHNMLMCIMSGVSCFAAMQVNADGNEHEAIKAYKKSVRKRIAEYEDMDTATNTENASGKSSRRKKSSFLQNTSEFKKSSAFQNYVNGKQVKQNTEKILSQTKKRAASVQQSVKGNTTSLQSYWEKIKAYINSLIETIKKYLNAFLKKYGYGDLTVK